MKEILVTGASGLVGSKFIELNKNRYNFITPDFPAFDMTDEIQVKDLFEKESPEVIVNFAAFTDVTGAENQRDDRSGSCWRLNVEGVKNLMENTQKDCVFIQISTDYVFPGSSDNPGPYREDAGIETDSQKLTWYGFTKAEGERQVLAGGRSRVAILRLICPFSARYDLKMDFLRKPLSLFDQNKLYPMFNDQQVSVVLVDKVSEALTKIIDEGKTGIFHASSMNVGTPYEIISYLLEKARGVKDAVKPASLDEFLKTVDNPVRYSKYGGLRIEDTEDKLGIKYGTWQEMVDEFVRQQAKGI